MSIDQCQLEITKLQPDSLDKENDRLPVVRSRLAGRLLASALIESLAKVTTRVLNVSPQFTLIRRFQIGVRAEPVSSMDHTTPLVRVVRRFTTTITYYYYYYYYLLQQHSFIELSFITLNRFQPSPVIAPFVHFLRNKGVVQNGSRP